MVTAPEDHSLSAPSVATDVDLAAVTVATPGSYGEIGVVDVSTGELRVRTGHTAAALPGVEPFRPCRRTFRVGDGSEVEAWLVRDPAVEGPTPLLLDVHGGPHLAWSATAESAHPYLQLFAAQGWTVLLVNPRGSDGYGETFFRGSVASWGLGVERDLLDPVDRLVADGVADPDGLAVCGYSYGGFMVCHLTTRTDRFAAAVAGGAVTELVNMAGTSDESQVIGALQLCGSTEVVADALAAQTPLRHVDRVTTPTLLLHGVDDDRCPVAQSELWFTALRRRRVPCQLVLYPDAPHQFMAD